MHCCSFSNRKKWQVLTVIFEPCQCTVCCMWCMPVSVHVFVCVYMCVCVGARFLFSIGKSSFIHRTLRLLINTMCTYYAYIYIYAIQKSQGFIAQSCSNYHKLFLIGNDFFVRIMLRFKRWIMFIISTVYPVSPVLFCRPLLKLCFVCLFVFVVCVNFWFIALCASSTKQSNSCTFDVLSSSLGNGYMGFEGSHLFFPLIRLTHQYAFNR